MYAGTKVNWHEVLMSDAVTDNNNESLPLFLCVFSADKGTEEITDFTYPEFKRMYGNNADFFKHGQPLIQAHSILAAGGRVLGKRLVADNATLANLIIVAEIISEFTQKTDASGAKLYIDENGNETTTVTETEATEKKVTVKYTRQSVEGATTFDQVEEAAAGILSDTKFPIFIICDNGRGVSYKNVRITPDYDASKTLSFMLYNIQDIEGTTVMESQRFSGDPDAITYISNNKRNMGLSKSTMTQFTTKYYKNGFDAFVDKLATEAGYVDADGNADLETLYGLDFLFAKTKKGVALDTYSIDSSDTDLTATYGYTLVNGDNGSFGDAPFAGETPTPEWTAQAVSYLSGNFSDEIYDLDYHKIDFCVDANYPYEVKHKICELADFREDFFYFRDLGLDINNLADVQAAVSDLAWEHSPFVGDYMTTYDIIDDFSRKQIRVTMLHGVAPLLVNHYLNNPNAPVAGEFNNFIITEAIENTLNVIPRITPVIDMKTILDDLRVNYANYSSDDGIVAVQSTYTSQDHWGPLSFSSNVIITQMCVKDIRRYCPKIRFMLTDGNDFTQYKKLIQDNVISYYEKYFKSIELIYTRDDDMIAQKIFNASLYCYYKDFPQGEIFDVFAVEGSPDTNPAY